MWWVCTYARGCLLFIFFLFWLTHPPRIILNRTYTERRPPFTTHKRTSLFVQGSQASFLGLRTLGTHAQTISAVMGEWFEESVTCVLGWYSKKGGRGVSLSPVF